MPVNLKSACLVCDFKCRPGVLYLLVPTVCYRQTGRLYEPASFCAAYQSLSRRSLGPLSSTLALEQYWLPGTITAGPAINTASNCPES